MAMFEYNDWDVPVWLFLQLPPEATSIKLRLATSNGKFASTIALSLLQAS